MTPFVARAAAHRVGQHARRRGWFDIRYGFALLRSREVPVGKKLLALSIGLAATAVVYTFEIPVEAILGLLIPFLGLGFDLAIDGLEFAALPVLVACMLLPRLVAQPTKNAA